MSHESWPLLHHELDDFTEPWRTPSAETVLLHPGLGGNSRLYRGWVPLLGDRFRVLRIDPRGHGSSPRPAGYVWSLDNFANDVITLLDHLEIDHVHWVGASGGGIIGQHVTLSFPHRVQTLSLLATTANFRGPAGDYDEWLAPLDQGDTAAFLWRDAERRFGLDDEARTAWIIQELCRTPASYAAELHRWVRTVDLTDRIDAIACPTLVVTGGLDTLTSLDEAHTLAERIPNAQLEIVPNRPHNVAYTHPQLIAPIVRRFLLAHTDAMPAAPDECHAPAHQEVRPST